MFFVGLVVCACVYYILRTSEEYGRKKSVKTKSAITTATVWSIALVCWPLLWKWVVGEESSNLVALPGLLWPIGLIIYDLHCLIEDESTMRSRRPSLSMDANTICSLTFALSSILGAHNNECCKNIFMTAILGCIAFVLPTPHTSENELHTSVSESVQKSILSFSTGLVLTGILLMTHHRPSSASNF